MEKRKISRKERLSDCLLALGGAAVTAGVCMIHLAAGIIVGGILLIAFGTVLGLGGDGN